MPGTMPAPEIDPILARKFTPRYLAALIGAALGILVIGSALRPPKPASGAVTPPTQTEMRRLQRLAERRDLETMASHFAGIAADVGRSVLRVETGSQSGIVWSPNLVVGAGQSGPASDSVTLLAESGATLASLRVIGGPDLPLAAFQVSSRLTPTARRGTNAPELRTGEWLVAVWRDEGGQAFTPGHYVETLPIRCGGLSAHELSISLDLSPQMAGAGLFDLDGALVGVVLPCEERHAALNIESVIAALAHGGSVEGRLVARYGLRVVPLEEAIRSHFRTDAGVLVSEVWTGFAAELIGLRPGDVIVGVDGNPVGSPEDLKGLLDPTERGEVVLEVWRARRSREVRLSVGVVEAPGEISRGEPGLGLGLAAPGAGFTIGPIVAGSPAAAAGIREGDLLLRVDFLTPRSALEAQRALSRKGQPVFLEIQRGTRRFGALLG